MTMNVYLCTIGVLCSIPACVNAGGEPIELPRLTAKPYVIGIAPSHATVSPKPLFESDSGWAQVAQETDMYKYYGVQLMQGSGWDWTTHLDAMKAPADPQAMTVTSSIGNQQPETG